MMTFAEYNARLCNKDLQEYFQYLLLERERPKDSEDETTKDIIAELQGIVFPSRLDGRSVIELREQNEIAANLAEQGKIDESIAKIQQILEIYPEHYSAYYTLGVISFGQGNIEEALERFKEAFEYNPFFTDAVLRIFDCCICLGDTHVIEELLSKALTLQPDDYELLETKEHLKNGTYPKRLEEHIKKPPLDEPGRKTELLRVKQMLESGNVTEALQKLKTLI